MSGVILTALWFLARAALVWFALVSIAIAAGLAVSRAWEES